MAKESRHRLVGSFLTRSRPSVRPALEALEMRLAPAVYTVTSSLDDGSAGTLRDCIAKANSTVGVADTIVFATTQPIVLTSRLDISDTVAIVGVSGLTTIEGPTGALFGLFAITAAAGNVTLANLELTGGHTLSLGGAIDNEANLTLQNCWIHDNSAGEVGGAVYTTGTLTVTDCLFQANSASSGGFGGGIFVDSANASVTGTTFLANAAGEGGGVSAHKSGEGISITVDFRDCTFSENRATAGNGGALATGAYSGDITADLFDCTLSKNTASGGFGGAYSNAIGSFSSRLVYQGSLFANNSTTNLGGGGLISLGHNLSTDGTGNLVGPGDLPKVAAPDLGSLGYYGGPTPTIPLLAGSPALDAGTILAGTTDQRGVSRPQGAAPDIGAFEVRPQRIALATGDQFANVDAAFSRTGTGSVTGDGDGTIYVDYGDSNGAPASPVEYGPGSTFTLSHAYSADGTYEVTVSLIDSTGTTRDTRRFQVDVFLVGVDTSLIDEETISGPGTVIAKETDPADGASVTATLMHLDNTTASLLVGIVPTSVAAGLNGSAQIAGNTIASSFELRAVGVGSGDKIAVVFHYFDVNAVLPILLYYDRATGREGVVSSAAFIVDPNARTITLVLDAGSTPGILDIGGTVFTVAVPLAVTPDANAVSALDRGGVAGGFEGGGEVGSGGAFSASFQVTGNPALVVFASFAPPGDPSGDGSFGNGFAIRDKTNLLADLPIVPDTLITLPGAILTPGSAEMPVPDEPPKTSTSPGEDAPTMSRLDDSEADDPDVAFVSFGDGRPGLRFHSLPSWPVEGEGGDAPADWRDTSLAIAAFLAARPVVAPRRSFAKTPGER